MISIFNRIANRAKKLLILLIIIPLLTAAVSYYLESKKPTTYTSTSKVYIGTVSNDYKGDLSDVEELVKSEKRLPNINDDVIGRLVVTPKKNIIQLQYSGTDEKEVKDTLTDITNDLKQVINKKYNEKLKHLNENLAESDKEQLALALKAQVKNDIEASKDNLEPAEVTKSPDLIAAYSNPLKRGLFGLILGLMLDFVILVTPELFREYR